MALLKDWPEEGPLSRQAVLGEFVPKCEPMDRSSRKEKRKARPVEIQVLVRGRSKLANDGQTQKASHPLMVSPLEQVNRVDPMGEADESTIEENLGNAYGDDMWRETIGLEYTSANNG